MGTISEKLNYLNDTRLKIKDGLNKFGADLTENDTFRSYSNVLNDIYGKLPKVSGNGSNFTLENVQNGKLDLFEMEGNTHQDNYSGKNLLLQNEYISSKTVNGITYTNNGDGTFNLSGTATANTSLRIIDAGIFNLKSGQAYYLYSSVPYNINTFNMSIVAVVDGVDQYFRANTTYTPSTTPTNSRLQFYIAKDNTVNATNVKLMLVKGSTAPTSYEPYVGGTPSPNPDYPQEIEVVENKQIVNVHGKNLLLYPYTQNTAEMYGVTFTVQNDGSVLVNGTASGGNANIKLYGNYQETNQLPFTGKYLFGGTNNVRLRALNNTNNNYTVLATDTGSGAEINMSTHKKGYIELTVLNGTTVNNEVIKPMVLDSLDDTTYEPYHNQDYEIDLTNNKFKINYDEVTTDLKYIPFQLEPNTNYLMNTTLLKNLNNSSNAAFIFLLNGNVTTGANTTNNGVWLDNPKVVSSDENGYITVAIRQASENPVNFNEYKTILIKADEEFYDYKICKIEDYKDVIFKNNQLSEHYDNTLDEDSWYIKKEIGKVVLDGSENWSLQSINDYGIANFQKSAYINDYVLGKANLSFNNYFSPQTSLISRTQTVGYFLNTAKILFVRFKSSVASTTTEFKTWLSTHNTIIYYVLDTPTYEKITDETLINQLEAIETETGTNIFEVSNENNVLPSLNVKRLKELEKLS